MWKVKIQDRAKLSRMFTKLRASAATFAEYFTVAGFSVM